MGSSSSQPINSRPPPTPPPPPALKRELSAPALDVLAEQLRKARTDAARYKRIAEDSLADVDAVVDEMERQRQEFKTYGLIAVVGTALVGSVVGGAAAAAVLRRQHVSVLARLSQETVDLRRRSASELAKAERFGSERLAKSMIPALDAMDALCEAAEEAAGAGVDSEGSRLTRASWHSALQSNGIECIRPEIGDKFDVASMEAMFPVPVEPGSTGKVEAVLRPGYVLHGERVLRAAQVGVGTEADA